MVLQTKCQRGKKKSISSEMLILLLQLCNAFKPCTIWGQSVLLLPGAMPEKLC